MAVYLNTYEVWQSYGGPEEGGWWYQSGTPVQSIKFSDEDYDEWLESKTAVERVMIAGEATLAFTQGMPPTPSKTGYGGYTFVGDSEEPSGYYQDNDYRSWFEDHYGKEFPQERPQYC